MNTTSLRCLVAAAIAAAVPAQDWSALIAAQWPADTVAKVGEAQFLAFTKQHGLVAKDGWSTLLAAQYQALGLPVASARELLSTTAFDVSNATDALVAENEPNDTSGAANGVAAGDHVEASLTAGDSDWFTFTVPQPGELTIYTNPGPNGVVTDTVLELYDAQLGLLAVNDDNRGLLSTIRGLVPAGTYFARVRHFNANGTGDYSLDISSAITSPIVGEAAEPNDLPATATPFEAGRSGEGRIVIGGDQDWWSFTLSQPLTIVADTGGAPLGPVLQDSTLTLWDATGTTQLAFDDDTGPGLFARLVVSLPAGTYHLAVGGYQLNTGRYSLRLDSALGQVVQVAEAAEPNGTVATATAFGPSFLGNGEVLDANDHDFWLFTVTQNARIAVGTGPGTSGTALLDPTLALRRLDGSLIAADDDSGPDLQAQLFVDVPQGTYVLDVDGFQALTGTYTLDLIALPGQNASRAIYQVLGGGCPGSNNLVPSWRVRPFEVPLLGTTLVGEFGNAPASTLIVGFAGLSTSITSQGQPLPVSLAPFGAPGCVVNIDPFVTTVLLGDANGAATWPLVIPYSTVFISVDIFQQGMVLDPAANALGVTLSNFGRGVVGERL